MNPYLQKTLLDGMLAHEDRFIGLRDEVEWLLASVSEEKPRAISLVGPLGIGKSFVLQFLAHPRGARRVFSHIISARRFQDDPERLLFVLIEADEFTMTNAAPCSLPELLYTRVLSSLAELLQIPDACLIPLDRLHISGRPPVARLREQVQRSIDAALNESDDDELHARFERVVGTSHSHRLLRLLRHVDAWGVRMVFLVDKFDAIAGDLHREDFDHLRAVLPVAALVLATRRALSEQVPEQVQTSPFFNLLEQLNLVNLHFLSPEDARRMITDPPGWFPESRDFRFSDSDVDFILDMTGLHPDLIRMTCASLYTWTRRNPVRSGDRLPLAERPYMRARLRNQFTDFFALLWHSLAREPEGQSMLMGVASGQLSVDEQQTMLPPSLSMLINRGYVVVEAGRYRLFASLFEDYVLQQMQLGTQLAPVSLNLPLDELDLTGLERKFLDLLLSRRGATVDRNEITTALYGQDAHQVRSRLDTLISRLRPKLEQTSVQIESIRGQGYRLVGK